MTDEFEGEYDFVVAKPQLFHWVADDETEGYLSLDHVLGVQIETTEYGRHLYVALVNNQVNDTTNEDQIERFMALWEIV